MLGWVLFLAFYKAESKMLARMRVHMEDIRKNPHFKHLLTDYWQSQVSCACRLSVLSCLAVGQSFSVLPEAILGEWG